MITHCANPDCAAPFLYLRQGRLFATPRPGLCSGRSRVEYFWLCGNCAGHLKIDYLPGHGMSLIPRTHVGPLSSFRWDADN